MEKKIKEALFWWLEKTFTDKTITTEVALKNGRKVNVVDILMAAKSNLYAFEIKGPGDTLKRLPAQIDTYTRLFDYVYVVYWRGKFAIEDESVGLIEAYEQKGEIRFRRIRRAKKHRIDHRRSVNNFFKEEMRFFLRSAPTRAAKAELAELMLKEKSPSEIVKIYKTVMRYRYRWGYLRYKICNDWDVFKREKIKGYLNIG